jgi:hypothetical protein
MHVRALLRYLLPSQARAHLLFSKYSATTLGLSACRRAREAILLPATRGLREAFHSLQQEGYAPLRRLPLPPTAQPAMPGGDSRHPDASNALSRSAASS